jgi:hypothetical protein
MNFLLIMFASYIILSLSMLCLRNVFGLSSTLNFILKVVAEFMLEVVLYT